MYKPNMDGLYQVELMNEVTTVFGEKGQSLILVIN